MEKKVRQWLWGLWWVLLASGFDAGPGPAAGGEAGLNRGQIRVVTKENTNRAPVTLYTKSHALVIGMSQYREGWRTLPGVARDVEAIVEVLKPQFDSVTLKQDLNGKQLREALEEFVYGPGKEKESRLLIYFAGHGETQKMSYGGEMGYLVPVDAPKPERDEAGFEKVALSMNDIDNYARKIQAKHALFLFDSCFSGSVLELSRGEIKPPPAIVEKSLKPVRQFITAGAANETVPDRSLFREYLVRGLAGEADSNQDSYVTASELGAYLENKIVNESNSTWHPQFGTIKDARLNQGDVVVAVVVVKKPEPPPAPPAEPKPDPTWLLRAELNFWEGIRNTDDPALFLEYLEKYPQGQYVSLARRKLKELEEAQRLAKLTPPPVTPVQPQVTPQPVTPPPASAAQIALGRVKSELKVDAQQRALRTLGHYAGAATGEMNDDTRQAIRAYQHSRRERVSGELTPEQAVALIVAAAARGNPASQTDLGWMYTDGVGVVADFPLAGRYFFAAATQGYEVARKNLAKLLEKEAGRLDAREIEPWRKAAQGQLVVTIAPAVLAEALKALDRPAPTGEWPVNERLELILAAAERGQREAQNLLAIWYGSGLGMAKDPQQSVRWFRAAAAQGSASARYNLALLLLEGDGVPADPSEAKRLLRLAADAGAGTLSERAKEKLKALP